MNPKQLLLEHIFHHQLFQLVRSLFPQRKCKVLEHSLLFFSGSGTISPNQNENRIKVSSGVENANVCADM